MSGRTRHVTGAMVTSVMEILHHSFVAISNV